MPVLPPKEAAAPNPRGAEVMTTAHVCSEKDHYTSLDGKIKVRVCRECRGVDVKIEDGDWRVMTADQWDLPHLHESQEGRR